MHQCYGFNGMEAQGIQTLGHRQHVLGAHARGPQALVRVTQGGIDQLDTATFAGADELRIHFFA
ncbi:hypothetical protein D3C80_850130 [compost metagenome]